MCHTDALVINDSEGLFQSPKRRDITGARTYVLLSPQVGITGLENNFPSATILIAYITRLIPLLPVI